MEAIAVTGIGCRFPSAPDPEAYWTLLSEGREAIASMPDDRLSVWTALGRSRSSAPRAGYLSEIDAFEPEFFGISPREAASMDPQQRLLLELAFEALEDAGELPTRLAESQVGVFVGAMNADHALLHGNALSMMDAHLGVGSSLGIAANRLSYAFDFQGPSMVIDTLCSSSLVAVHLACQALRDDQSMPLALAAGINLMTFPAMHLFYERAGLLSPDAHCRPFDAAANGMVRGEGGGVVVLKRLSQALDAGDSIYCVIRGSAVNQDGKSNGLTAPNRFAQERVIRAAYRNAGVSLDAVSYVEAHGTGTLVGDPIELKALAAVLKGRRGPPCPVGSVKSNFGHLESAAGMAALIKTALMLRHERLCPSLHFQTPNPFVQYECLPLRVLTRAEPWESRGGPRVAGVSSFGLGGTNAHVVLEQATNDDVTPARAQPGTQYFLPLSAKSDEALRAVARGVQSALELGEPSLVDLAWTLCCRRGHYAKRLAVMGSNHEALSTALSAWARQAQFVGDGDTERLLGSAQPGSRETLAALEYLAGGDVEPASIVRGRVLRLLPYPFQRRQLSTPILSVLANARRTQRPSTELLYRRVFREVELPPSEANPGPTLIFGAEPALELALRAGLSQRGLPNVAIPRADALAELQSKDAYRAMLAQASERLGAAPQTIVYCLALGDCVPSGDGASLEPATNTFGNALGLFQALLATSSPSRVWVATQKALAREPSDEVNPAAAALLGLCQVVRVERPRVLAGVVDVQSGANAAEQAAALLRVVCSNTKEPVLRSRDDGYWAPRLVRDEVGSGSAHIDLGGTVLISGGLGALGLRTGRALVERGARHVALLGRREPSDAARSEIATWQAMGALVRTYAVDVADHAALERTLQAVASSMPAVCGVVHCAGSLDDALLQNQNVDRFAAVARGKVLGAHNLDRCLAERELSFFVVFSSIAAVLGSPGQANYAAANTALHALAHERKRRGQRATVLHYGPWAEAGMAAPLFRDDGLEALTPSDAVDALFRVLESDAFEATVVQVDWAKLGARNPVARELPLLAELLDQAPLVSEALDLTTPGGAEAWIVQQLAITLTLPPDRIARDVPLEALGLDSMLGLELKERIERELSKPLPVDTLMDASVSQIVEAFDRVQRESGARASTLVEAQQSSTARPAAAPMSGAAGLPPSPTPWLVPVRISPHANVRLFCFAYAGGAAQVYRSWSRGLGEHIDVWAVELPGRGTRRGEPLLTSVDAIVDELFDALLPQLGQPFAFFGHCLGAIVMFETARRAVKAGRLPRELFVSGAPAPQMYLIPAVYVRSDEHFREVLELINFKSSEPLLKDEALLRRALPSVRADFQAAAEYRFRCSDADDDRLPVPITAFGAHEDLFAPHSALQPWRERTSAAFRLYMRPGEHYFLETERDFLHRTLDERLAPQIAAAIDHSNSARMNAVPRNSVHTDSAHTDSVHPMLVQPGRPKPGVQANTVSRRLFCFPFVGSNERSFEAWRDAFDDTTEVVSVLLPDAAAPHAPPTLEGIATHLLPELLPLLDRPFAFFGHDLGALLMREVTLRLRSIGHPLPEHWFVSRSMAPQLNFFPPVHLFGNERVAQLGRFFGLPRSTDDDLRRAFELVANYRAPTADPMPVPITAFAGKNDTLVPSAGVQGWEDCTSRTFDLVLDDAAHDTLTVAESRGATPEKLKSRWARSL